MKKMIIRVGRMISDEKLLKQFKKNKRDSSASQDAQHAEARINHAFHDGDKQAYIASVQDKGRKIATNFNKVKPYVDAVAGFMIQLRRKPSYQARMIDNVAQQQLSIYMNGLSDYARNNANMSHIESAQDREMLISGYAAIDTNILYEKNPDGEICAENIKYDDIYWDPNAQDPNVLSSRWVIRRKAYYLDEALKRFKGSTPEDFESYTGDGDEFSYNPYGGEYDKIAVTSETLIDLIQVYYYQWFDLEDFYRAKNPLYKIEDPEQVNFLAQMMVNMRDNRAEVSDDAVKDDLFEFDPFSETLSMTSVIKNDLKELFDRFDIEFNPIHEIKRVYYTAILSGNTVFQKFKSPDQNGFTIKFKTATYDTSSKRWYGMVDSLREPARYMNKSLTEMMYVIAGNSKGGVMYEESAVDDPERFEQQWARTAAAIRVSDGAISGGKIAPKANAVLPSGYENIYGIADQSIGEVSGIGKEFLGTANNSQVSALLESQRVNQVVSTLATYFDAASLYQKEHARLMVTFLKILAENSEGRLISIIGQDGAQRFEPLTTNNFADEYDIEIGDAPTSATQKKETSIYANNLADRLALQGIFIYDVAVQYTDGIKQSDKQIINERIRAATTPDPQQAQLQAQIAQEQAQLQRVAAQSLIEERQSKIAKNVADAQATMASIPGELADAEKTQAETDNTRADTVKTLAEAEQKDAENDALRSMPLGTVNVTI